MTQFILDDILHLHATLLTDDQQSDKWGHNVKDGLTVHYNNLHHILQSSHSSRFCCGTRQNEGGELPALSAADVQCILDVYFCWRDMPIDDVVNVS